MSGQSINIFANLDTSVGFLTGSFENKLFQFISRNEGANNNRAYAGNNVNIGYGYNITAQINAGNPIDYFISDFKYVASLNIPGTTIDINDLTTDANLVIKESASAAATTLDMHYILTPGITGSEWQLSILALNRIIALTGLIQTTSPTQGPTSYDTNAFIVPPSYELVALEDMAYNGNKKLIGPKTHLIGDLKEATLAANAGDWMNAWSSRDEAWYEIAFNSDSISDNGTNAFGLEMRYLRDAQEFGLYSQGPGWTAGNIKGKTFQTSINMPNATDGGEGAVAALRVVQDESSAITSFLSALQSRFPTDYKSTLISAAELISEYESPAVELLNQLYATPYGRSFDASHVIDTQAVNGLVAAPATGSYMLIGAQFATIADPSVTGGFTYGAPLSDKLVSGPNGGDVLLGFAGNNTLMINGSGNIAFNDVVTIPGVETYHNFDTITGDHNTLYTSIGAARVSVNAKSEWEKSFPL